jgi:hypothetical protein
LEVILKENKGVEGVRFFEGRGAGGARGGAEEGGEIIEHGDGVGGGGEEEGMRGGEVGGGGSKEGIVEGHGVGDRVGVFEFFEKAVMANGAGEIGGRRGDEGHRTVALVAEVELRRRCGAGGCAASANGVSAIIRHFQTNRERERERESHQLRGDGNDVDHSLHMSLNGVKISLRESLVCIKFRVKL